MYIPSPKAQSALQRSSSMSSKVVLQSSHIVVTEDVVNKLFPGTTNVNVVYYSSRRSLMIAPSGDELFKTMHKAKQHMLKARNDSGDMSIAIHELLIDNEIYSADRSLEYEIQIELKILNIKL